MSTSQNTLLLPHGALPAQRPRPYPPRLPCARSCDQKAQPGAGTALLFCLFAKNVTILCWSGKIFVKTALPSCLTFGNILLSKGTIIRHTARKAAPAGVFPSPRTMSESPKKSEPAGNRERSRTGRWNPGEARSPAGRTAERRGAGRPERQTQPANAGREGRRVPAGFWRNALSGTGQEGEAE